MLSKLIKWYFKALWWMIILMVPLFTIMVPLGTIYDWARPWDEAVAALKKEKEGGLRWMVGTSYERESVNGEVVNYHRQRDFVVVPSVFLSPTVYEFSEGTGVEKGLKVRPYGALGYLFLYAVMISFSWFVSVRKIKWLFRFPKSPNQMPEPTSGLAPGRGSS